MTRFISPEITVCALSLSILCVTKVKKLFFFCVRWFRFSFLHILYSFARFFFFLLLRALSHLMSKFDTIIILSHTCLYQWHVTWSFLLGMDSIILPMVFLLSLIYFSSFVLKICSILLCVLLVCIVHILASFSLLVFFCCVRARCLEEYTYIKLCIQMNV